MALLWAASASAAAPSLEWAGANATGAGALDAISCPSEALCVASEGGRVLTSTAPAAPSWQSRQLDTEPLTGVSCASTSFCMAVAGDGKAFTSSAPAAGAWEGKSIGGHFTGVSCVEPQTCVAVEEGVIRTRDAAGVWSSASVGGELRAVSCVSASACIVLSADGTLYTETSPGTWQPRKLDLGSPFAAISCTTSRCVALDEAGDALASESPWAPSPTWSATSIGAGPGPFAASCAASGLCVTVRGDEEALASDEPASARWSLSRAPGERLTAISCLSSGVCFAADALGRVLVGRVPAPEAVALKPALVTATTATLSGSVNPHDATLTACYFEYGTTTAYGSLAPCASVPGPGSSAVAVASQPLTGLFPNTTYHYRLIAASATGARESLDETFTTPVLESVAIVHPHPSIHGTPAVGAHLTCVANASGATHLTYAWLRDLVPIPTATGSTYLVKGQDSGHHLQCEVTASDAGGDATARSSFVTIPVGGIPAAAGETSVGRGLLRGRDVYVSVSCSPHASRGCNVVLRLTATSARRTVTLGGARAFLPAGARRTIAIPLKASARRLLAARHRLAATLAATGTVIGVIEAVISRQQLQLGAKGAARRARVKVAAEPRSATPGPRRARVAAVLAATPYMGWDTYFALGGRYSESSVLEQASQLITLGLRQRGYRYVWLDVGWWHGTRDANGQITVSPQQWPHGLPWLTRALHAAGLRVGLYTDAGANGCGGAGQGSYGHYQQDVNTFAAWGFDAVKVDFCGGAELGLAPAAAYTAFHHAIEANASHRPMLLSICNFLQPGQYAEGQPTLGESAFASYTFGPGVGTSWRTDTDVGLPGDVTFADVLRNMDADAAAPQAAGPGHWNDPDYLGPDQGLSATQFRTQLSMWAMLAAPLMISDDLTRISAASRTAVQNSEVIAIDQDPAGVQGMPVSSAGDGQVWVKPLVDGSRAVALLNRGATPLRVATSAATVGMPPDGGGYALRDEWSHRTTLTGGTIEARVPGDGVVLLRVTAR